MHFKINRIQFLKHLSDVQRAISSKTTIPVLTGIKLFLTNTELILTGSDANISIEKIISSNEEDNDLTILNNGKIVLPSRLFIEIIKKLSDEIVTIELLTSNKIKITSGKSIFNINGIDADLYPNISIDSNTTQSITIPAFLFKNILSQTVIAASTSENRPILTGIHLVIENNQLIATATDSHRMSRRVVILNHLNTTDTLKCTIPAKSLIELSKIISDEDVVELTIFENKVLFTTKNLYFYSRLLEGNYPDVSRLLYSEYETTISLNSNAFLNAVERASILSTEGKNDFVTLHIESSQLKISSESTEIGYVEEDIEYEQIIGPQLTISFNPNYMKDALKILNNSDMTIHFQGDGKPFILKLTGPDADQFVQLITPIRTRQ